MLHADSSCREAVALALSQRAAAAPELVSDPKRLPSDDPSAYCQARQRLPLKTLQNGVARPGRRLREEVGQTVSWCGRRVWLVDGTNCSMPDTPATWRSRQERLLAQTQDVVEYFLELIRQAGKRPGRP